MTFADLFNSLLESSKERIKNPLLGSIFTCFIIYNWRPIFFLLFSKQPIEDTIEIINNEYCYPLAILLPILFAVIYTIYLPMLMVLIDKNLESTKIERIENLYIYKDHTVTKKIDLAGKEYQLKSIESGNKEREDMIKDKNRLKKEIETLKKEITESNENNSNIVHEINAQLNANKEVFKEVMTASSNEIKELKSFNNKVSGQLKSTHLIMRIIFNLTKEDLRTLIAIRNDSMISELLDPRYSTYDEICLLTLINADLIEREGDNIYSLTLRGTNVVAKIEELELIF